MTALIAIALGIGVAILFARILLGGLFEVLFRHARASGAGSDGAGKAGGPPQAAPLVAVR